MKRLPHWVLTDSHPAFYDCESATAIEQTAKVYGAMNELIDETEAFTNQVTNNINEFTDSVVNHLSEQDVDIENQKNNVIPATIKNEIQSQIDNGSFDAQINSYIGNLEERVDNLLGSVTEGSTTMDAEIIDARVGQDGSSYPNLGESIRNQISKGLFDEESFYYYNRLNPNTIVDHKYINTGTGALLDNPSYWASDYIRIKAGETLYFTGTNMVLTAPRFYAFYDEAKNFISGATDAKQITNDVGASFFRISSAYDSFTIDQLMVSPANLHNGFIEYGTLILKRSFTDEHTPHLIAYTNRYDQDKALVNHYPSNLTGETMYNTSYFCTDYIPILKGETLALFDQEMNAVKARFLACYNQNGEFIEVAESEFVASITQTGDIAYVRFGVDVSNLDNLMIDDASAPVFLSYGEVKIKDNAIYEDYLKNDQMKSIIGGSFVSSEVETLSVDNVVTLSTFPHFIKKNVSVSFKGDFTSFSKLSLGHGGEGVYSGYWVEIDNSYVTIKNYGSSTNTVETIKHELSISDFIYVTLGHNEDGTTLLTIVTSGGSYTKSLNWNYNQCGEIFAKSTSEMSNVKLVAGCEDLSKPLWLIGDSYFGASDERIFGQLKNYDYTNYLIIGQPGLKSAGAYSDVLRALQLGTPKVIVWYLGMNDGADATTYETYFTTLKAICEEKDVTLILNKVPSVPTIAKEEIGSVIENSGLRYIDSYAAVGSSESGEWKTGLLSSDGVHPTIQGAKVLASQMLVDVPEIIAYGRK